jgi:hypothetical protein
MARSEFRSLPEQLAAMLGTADGKEVTQVTLYGQGIGTAGAAELAEMLKTHPSIASLDLGDNPIGEAGTAVLAEALLTNHQLTSLLCHAEDKGAEAIVEALSCNQKLVSVAQDARASAAAACKIMLPTYLRESAALINRAVAAQAQLETQRHRIETLDPVNAPATPSFSPSPSLPLPSPSPPPPPPPSSPSSPSATPSCTDTSAECVHWASKGECSRNAVYMSHHCRRSCKLCDDVPPSTPPLGPAAMAAAAATTAVTPAATPVPEAASTPTPHVQPEAAKPEPPKPAADAPTNAATSSDSPQAELLKWLDAHQLSATAHLPLLAALGVQRVSGRVGSLQPLRHLSFADLSAELAASGAKLPCAPTCAADKAALFAALKDY